MATIYNLSGTGEYNVEVPFQDTMEYHLQLKDTNLDVLSLTGKTFEFECYYGKHSVRFTATGVLNDDEDRVVFTANTTLAVKQYKYRIRQTTTSTGAVKTVVRGIFKVT